MKQVLNNSFLLKNALLYGEKYDISVKEGKIASCIHSGSQNLDNSLLPEIDANGCILFPSFIDAHTHMREPGFEYKEDIATGLAAAAYGGFGSVLAMANTKPVNDSASISVFMIEQAKKFWPNGPNLYPVGAATIGLEGKELSPYGELVEAGCVAFSNDGKPITSTEIFRRAMEYSAQWGKIIIDHCEDSFLAKGSHMNEGIVSGNIGVKGQSVVAESLHVARDILLSEYLNIPVHLAHISCQQSVELIRTAKEKGIKVTAETCPHYLLLTDSALKNYDTTAKVCPPLRTQNDVNALKEAVLTGIIDIFVTDHAPHAQHEKELPFDEAPNGLIGLETAVPLTFGLVSSGELTERQFVNLWSTRPSQIFNLPVNAFNEGDQADFFLFDTTKNWTVNRDTIHSKSLNTPFLDQEMKGKVVQHWMNGYPLLPLN